jgi:DHA1 family tetracycline resistance protein-like MFS transporter
MTSPADTAPAATSNRSALFIVFLVVFIDLLGFGIVLPLLPVIGDEYVKRVLGLELTAKGSEGTVGLIVGLLMSSFSLMQFLFAPMWGRVSDRVGRRPILLLGLVGSVVFYALFGYAASLPAETQATLALTLFFVARTGAGIAGATIATAQAVIADSTPPDKRKHGMALIGAAFGIGFTFGPLIGYFSLSFFKSHPEAIGYVASALSFLALILGVWLMPETRRFGDAPPLQRRTIDFSALRIAFASATIAPVVLVFFLATLGFAAFEVTLAMLLRDSLGYGDEHSNEIFLFFAYVGFVLMFTQGFLYRKAAKTLNEVTLMAIGIVLMGAGVGALGYVAWQASLGADRNFLMWFLFPALTFAVVGFAFLTPSAQALISRRTEAHRQGEVLGVNQSASAMARILGPIAGAWMYKVTESHLLPYAFGAIVLVLMLPVLPSIRRGEERITAG